MPKGLWLYSYISANFGNYTSLVCLAWPTWYLHSPNLWNTFCMMIWWPANHIDIPPNLPPPVSPGPVGNMRVSSTSVNQLTVTWTPPTTGGVPTSYNVSINDSSSPVVIPDNGSSLYTHTFPGLISATLYTVSVVAINCAGTSSVTSETEVTCN